jgi:hypothetical protein
VLERAPALIEPSDSGAALRCRPACLGFEAGAFRNVYNRNAGSADFKELTLRVFVTLLCEGFSEWSPQRSGVRFPGEMH